MERHTSRRTRSQTSADEGQRAPNFQDWLEACGGIFIQQKPRANLQNLWENETSLVFSQDGSKPYTVSVPDGENIELKLICNMNFDLELPTEDSSKEKSSKSNAAKDNSKKKGKDEKPSKDSSWMNSILKKGTTKRRSADADGQPDIGYTTLCYSDIFCLTAKLSGLGQLEGPSTWTFELFHDWPTDSLLVQATGKSEGKRIVQKQLTIPLRLVPETHLRLYVDWEEMEKKIPGVTKEQKEHTSGMADKQNGALINKQRQSRNPKIGLFQPPVRPPELRDRKRG